ncbi:TetR/AcrR family transcriptional regulator [Streptomyces nitrosporeus]|uniref:TetR/AcrR family transcriptional regulator n=1 Tax=Streptomyces nitrosporeus TaxID=28894 RepID=UPI0033176883
MAQTNEGLREALLAAAEEQLTASPDHDVATRAVCEAVGVTQPVLYRLFGDKRGLLDALAEVGLHRYAKRKAALEQTDDPVADLRAGWDDHLAFAAENPAVYRLMFSPRPWADTAAREGVSRLLTAALTRCAAAGALRGDVEDAAALILSANTGLALNRIAQPGVYGRDTVSDTLRDAVLAAVVTAPAPARTDDPVTEAAHRLDAQLRIGPPTALASEETALLRVWLDRLARTGARPGDAPGAE